MPPLALAQVLNSALPPLPRTARALVDVLVCNNGLLPEAGEVPTYLGLRTRHQVARALRGAGLPPLHELAGWTRILYWLVQSEQTGASLLQLARQAELEPATCYRLVRRLTGETWSSLRRAGIAALASRFRAVLQRAERRSFAREAWLGGSQLRWVGAPGPKHSATRAVTSLAPLPGRPRGVLAGRLTLSGYPFDVVLTPGGTGWLTRTHAAVLEHVQIDPLASLGFIPVGIAPTRVVASAGGERAWVTNQFTKDISVVDLVERCRVGVITSDGDPLGAALSPDSGTLYVTTNLDRLVAYTLSEHEGRATRSVNLPQVCTQLVVHPAGNKIYLPTWRLGEILEIDVRNLATTHRFSVGGKPLGVAISRDGLRLYAGNECGWLDSIQLTNGHRLRRDFGAAVAEVALSPDQAVLYVSLRRKGQVAVVDAHNLSVMGYILTGGLPRSIAFDGTGRAALIANEAGWVDLVR